MTVPRCVIDASALVDLLVGDELSGPVAARIEGVALAAPAHLDAEILSALGRLQRAGAVPAAAVTRHLVAVTDAPIERRPVADLLAGAWRRRSELRLADALYVELAARLDVPLVTTDARLGRATPVAEVVTT